MSGQWPVVLVTVVGGAAVALQAQFAGEMNDRMGVVASIFVTYAGGGLVAGALMLLTGSTLAGWRSVPPLAFSAGVLGLVIVGSLAFSVPRVGVVGALLVFTVAQFVFAALIDHFGWFGAELRALDLGRLAGVALLVVGAWLALR